jgi:hypothetical protein
MEHFYQNIGENWFTYPNFYSSLVQNLKDGAKDIKEHRFFEDINFDEFSNYFYYLNLILFIIYPILFFCFNN